MKNCLECSQTTHNNVAKFCSNICQNKFQYKNYIQRWKTGIENGSKGINAKGISNHLRRYLLEKYNYSCSLCNWNKVNPFTLKVPLEVDHIDGNADNNTEDNLRILCPNCHSLTANFRNLNRGKGREWRRRKYIKH